MISIFNGRKRTLGGESSEIYAQIGVNFREYLHYLKGAKLHIFLAISLHANENGWAWPSVSLLAKETGYNPGTINDALKELCSLVINGERILLKFQPKSKENGQYHSNHYLIFPSAAEVAEYKDEGIHNTVSNLPSTENPETGKPIDKEEPAFEEKQTEHGADAPTSSPVKEDAIDEIVGEELVVEFFGSKQEKELAPITPHWTKRIAEDWTTWGAESEEMQRQLAFGERGRTVQHLGYELERQFALYPIWRKKTDVKSWMSGLAVCLDLSEGDEKIVIRAARELINDGMTVSDPWSLQKKTRALVAEKARGTVPSGLDAPSPVPTA